MTTQAGEVAIEISDLVTGFGDHIVFEIIFH